MLSIWPAWACCLRTRKAVFYSSLQSRFVCWNSHHPYLALHRPDKNDPIFIGSLMHFDIKASSYPQPLNALSRFSTGAHGLHRECLTSRSKCEAKPSQAELQACKADTDTSFFGLLENWKARLCNEKWVGMVFALGMICVDCCRFFVSPQYSGT